MDVPAKIRSKGQVTIPKSVREALDLHEGDEVLFRVESSRALLAKTRLPRGRGKRAGARWEARHRLGRSPAPDASRARRAPALTAFVDTNVLIRHLTGDPPEMEARATALLASNKRLLLADLVLAESIYGLNPTTRSTEPESPS